MVFAVSEHVLTDRTVTLRPWTAADAETMDWAIYSLLASDLA